MYRVYIVKFSNGDSATMLTDLPDSESVEGATMAAIERFGARRVACVHASQYQQSKAIKNEKDR